MDLERMSVRLRPRNAWEALDLGVALVRANLRPVYAAWLAVFVPAAVIAHVVFSANPFWAWVLLWWLKPAFDRAILAVLAPALFGEARPARAFFAAPTRAFRRTGLLPALTWRRLDFARSFHLPVVQLERLAGKPMRQRVRVLDRDSRGAAVWVSFLLLSVELILLLAISLALAVLLPVQTPIDSVLEAWGRRQFAMGEAGTLTGSIIAAFAVSIVEPVYVACGFTLYLQRRTHLEGWDIELRFRQLAARLSAGAAAIVLAVGIGVIVPHSDVHAATPEPRGTPAERGVREVLADKVFGHQVPSRSLKYVGPEWKSEGPKKEWNWDWAQRLAEFFAAAARFVAWTAAALVVAFALYYLARYVRMRRGAGNRGARPDFLFGLDVRPESLPDDVGAAAADLARRGAARNALSLLYRGALVRFMDEGLELQQGDTEGDCVRRVEAFAAPKRRVYFMRLVLAWQALAYAHRPIDGEALIALSREWGAHFGAPRGEAAPPAQAQPA